MKRAGCTATRTNGILLFVQLAVTVSLHWSRVGCCDRQTNSGGSNELLWQMQRLSRPPLIHLSPMASSGVSSARSCGHSRERGPRMLLTAPSCAVLPPALSRKPSCSAFQKLTDRGEKVGLVLEYAFAWRTRVSPWSCGKQASRFLQEAHFPYRGGDIL